MFQFPTKLCYTLPVRKAHAGDMRNISTESSHVLVVTVSHGCVATGSYLFLALHHNMSCQLKLILSKPLAAYFSLHAGLSYSQRQTAT